MKRDINYIASVEKAIEEKYGKFAIEHPKARWSEEKEEKFKEEMRERRENEQKKNDKEQIEEKEGFLIRKKLLIKTADRECPVCNTYSFSIRDDVYMNKYGACYGCYIKHIEDREDKWEERKKEFITNVSRET